MRKKLSRLKTNADTLWSTRIRSTGSCEGCNSTEHLQAHHIITKRFTPLRWSLKNGVCLCVKDHKFGLNSWHNNPIIAYEWLQANKPDIIEYLREKSKMPFTKITIEDMDEIIKDLQNEVI